MLLEVKQLSTEFAVSEKRLKAVDAVSFSVGHGETVAIVGESGCGKSVTALSIMRLIREPGRISGGEIFFGSTNILQLSDDEMRKIRGKRIGMIFQEPMTSLNPVFTIGDQIVEAIKVHLNTGTQAAKGRTVELLERVGIPSAKKRFNAYPHQLSGGMRQRVMIAMALSCKPDLLIADEPTTALDVTIKAQILSLLSDLQKEENLSVILITHDLGVVAETAEKVIVMYGGRIVEEGVVEEIFHNPKHPYTLGLLRSVAAQGASSQKRLYTIPGVVPDLLSLPSGCRFHNRCELCQEVCKQKEPELSEVSSSHFSRCYFSSSVIRK